MTDRKDFNRWVRWLRKEFSPCYPVTVLLVDGDDLPSQHIGYCTATPEREFKILILDEMDETTTIDCLHEEWAHVLRFHLWSIRTAKGMSEYRKVHDPIFWSIYGEIKTRWYERS